MDQTFLNAFNIALLTIRSNGVVDNLFAKYYATQCFSDSSSVGPMKMSSLGKL
jgi:hypothetical protein